MPRMLMPRMPMPRVRSLSCYLVRSRAISVRQGSAEKAIKSATSAAKMAAERAYEEWAQTKQVRHQISPHLPTSPQIFWLVLRCSHIHLPPTFRRRRLTMHLTTQGAKARRVEEARTQTVAARATTLANEAEQVHAISPYLPIPPHISPLVLRPHLFLPPAPIHLRQPPPPSSHPPTSP